MSLWTAQNIYVRPCKLWCEKKILWFICYCFERHLLVMLRIRLLQAKNKIKKKTCDKRAMELLVSTMSVLCLPLPPSPAFPDPRPVSPKKRRMEENVKSPKQINNVWKNIFFFFKLYLPHNCLLTRGVVNAKSKDKRVHLVK